VTRSPFVVQTPGNAHNLNYGHDWLWTSLTITRVGSPARDLKSGWPTPSRMHPLKHQTPTSNAFSPSLLHLSLPPLSRMTTTATRPESSSRRAGMPCTEDRKSRPMSPTFQDTLLSPISSYVLSRPASGSSGSDSCANTPLTPQSPPEVLIGAGGKVSPPSRKNGQNVVC
jgi:hypothetical protein